VSYDRAVRIIAGKAARYVEHVWPQLEKRGGTPDTPMNRKERGKSSSAIPVRGLDVVEANRIPSRYLRFFLEETEKGSVKSTNGVYFSEILTTMRYDPGNLTNWRALKTGEDKRMLEAFRQCMRHIAKGVIFVHGESAADNVDFEVIVNPRDEQLESTEQARVNDAAITKSHNTHTRYRNLVAETEEVMEEHGCNFEESWAIVNERRASRKMEPVSPSTFARARRFVRGEMDEGRGFSRVIEEAS
jgi:hypothetical protein